MSLGCLPDYNDKALSEDEKQAQFTGDGPGANGDATKSTRRKGKR